MKKIIPYILILCSCTIMHYINKDDISYWAHIPPDDIVLTFMYERITAFGDADIIKVENIKKIKNDDNYDMITWESARTGVSNGDTLNGEIIEREIMIDYKNNRVADDGNLILFLTTPVEVEHDIWNNGFKLEIREIGVSREIAAGTFDNLIVMDVMKYEVDVGDCYYSPEYSRWIYFYANYYEVGYSIVHEELISIEND